VDVVSRINAQLAQLLTADALRPLAEVGIGLEGIRAVPGNQGLSGFFRYRPDGERETMTGETFCRITGARLTTSADLSVRPHDRHYEQLHLALSPVPAEMPHEYRGADAFLLMTMPWLNQRAFVGHLADCAGSILLDPYYPYMVSATDAQMRDLLRNVRVILPSEIELRSRFPDDDLLSGARKLLALGVEGVVVKLGPRGSLVVRCGTDAVVVPAYRTRTKDPTGAGDSFLGGFAVGLLETNDLVQAALYGTVSASFVVEDFGFLHYLARERPAAERRLSELRQMLRL
jgi:ribokinase